MCYKKCLIIFIINFLVIQGFENDRALLTQINLFTYLYICIVKQI